MSRRVQDEEIVVGQRIKPQTREQRRALQDRDYLEKLRLANRKEGYQAYQDPGFINHASPKSALYVDEHSRFGGDFLREERERVAEERRRKDAFLRARQTKAEERALVVEGHMADIAEDERQRMAALQERGNRKNESGANFNLLTHAYNSGEDAQRAVVEDDFVRWRAEERRAELCRRGGYGYNPLTGEYAIDISHKPKPH